MDIGVSAFVFGYHSIGKKAEIMMMLTVCSSMLIIDFTGLNTMFMIIVLLGLWITHFETPLSLAPPSPPPSNLSDIFSWAVNGVQMCTLLSYHVIKCTYLVTFAKLNNRKEKCQLSDISFEILLPCMQISHYINNYQLNIEMASFPFSGLLC